MDLKNKNILILSPQSCGKMFISKHHYAIALAANGNKVYFLNPPDDPMPASGDIVIKESGMHDNLLLVDQRLYFPYNLKFHALPVFHFFMRRQVKKILQQIGQKIDIVWSFDLGHFYPFRFFPSQALKIFHPVDEPLNKAALAAAGGSDIIFSVTQEILDKYAATGKPRFFINHGLANEFLHPAGTTAQKKERIHAGFSGNMMRDDIDRQSMLSIINENPQVQFECWGSYRMGDSNIGGGANDAQLEFVRRLQAAPNVVLHGPVNVQLLSLAFAHMDMFLICYDINKDQSRGTNYHKVMEYMSTGKVIVSNNITTYNNKPHLVQMTAGREDNDDLPALFKKIAGSLDVYNAPDLQAARIAFARNNTYTKQVNRIEQIIAGLKQ